MKKDSESLSSRAFTATSFKMHPRCSRPKCVLGVFT